MASKVDRQPANSEFERLHPRDVNGLNKGQFVAKIPPQGDAVDFDDIVSSAEDLPNREDGPGVKWWNCDFEYRINGELHREGGPAAQYTTFLGRCQEWRVGGKLHREGGPAIEYDTGYKEWYVNGERHREDGPAVEYPDGHVEYWIHGKRIFK